MLEPLTVRCGGMEADEDGSCPGPHRGRPGAPEEPGPRWETGTSQQRGEEASPASGSRHLGAWKDLAPLERKAQDAWRGGVGRMTKDSLGILSWSPWSSKAQWAQR